MRLAVLIALLLWHPAIAEEFQVRCEQGWCIIKAEVLQMLVDGAKRSVELEKLCGWEK